KQKKRIGRDFEEAQRNLVATRGELDETRAAHDEAMRQRDATAARLAAAYQAEARRKVRLRTAANVVATAFLTLAMAALLGVLFDVASNEPSTSGRIGITQTAASLLMFVGTVWKAVLPRHRARM